MAGPEITPSNPEQTRESEANVVLTTAVNALAALKTKVDPTPETIETIVKAMDNAKERVEDASETVQAELEKALDELPGTLNALPDTLKTQAKENLNKIEQGRQTIFEKLKSGAKSGFEKVVDTLATTAEKVGSFMNKMWESLKPHLSRIAETPGIAFLLGQENLTALQGWLGYDADTLPIQESFRSRLDEKVLFKITTKKEIQLFKDVYESMLTKTGRTKDIYTYDKFIGELFETQELEVFTKSSVAAGELPMATVITEAKKFVNETKEVAQPVTPPITGVTTPAPATATK